MHGYTSALTRRFEEVDGAQAVGGALREQPAAAKGRRQLPGAEGLRRERRQRRDDVIDAVELDAADDVSQAALAGITRPPSRGDRPPAANVVLVEQQHLDEVRLGCVSNDGKATSLSNTSVADRPFAERRIESTWPCSSTRTIRST